MLDSLDRRPAIALQDGVLPLSVYSFSTAISRLSIGFVHLVLSKFCLLMMTRRRLKEKNVEKGIVFILKFLSIIVSLRYHLIRRRSIRVCLLGIGVNWLLLSLLSGSFTY
jgi:hypothetical protein